MVRLSLTLLGGFRALLDNDQALGLGIKKSQALLAYLALPLGQAHPRDKLAALLWGDMREAQARAGLRQTLFTLRKLLGDPEPLRLVGETVALEPTLVGVDVHAFEQRVALGTREALSEAAALYQGDLLEGLVLQERPFEDWLIAERLRLREVALEALARLLAQHRDSGALDEAVQVALRLVALDPLQESVHRTLMRLYTQLGRRGAALRQYQFCVAALQRELRAEPDDETRALYQQILQRRPVPASAAPSRQHGATSASMSTEGVPHAEVLAAETPLVGRGVKLAQLRDALKAAQAGQGRLLAVMGEAGIGKSRLVAELIAQASREGARLFLGRCYETEQVLPFGPWINALRASRLATDAEMLDRLGPIWRAELARLLPEIARGIPSTPTSDAAQLFEAVAQLLERVTLDQPVVMVFEDLHWADEMSLRLLAFVGRRLQRWRLLAVTTVRDEDLLEAAFLRHTLDELSESGRLTRLPLGSLSREDTAALARAIAQLPAVGRLDEQIWRASSGNPFIVVEILRALQGGSLPEDTPTLPLPDRVRDLIVQRLERLDEKSRRLLAAAAVIGRPFDFALLQRAADLGEAEAAEGVEELVRHRLLHGGSEGLEFTHDRIREVVYDQLLPARRALLHRRVAEALEALHAGALEPHALALGTHYREGEAWPQAVKYLGQAGVVASLRYAKSDAVACYEQALAALDHLPETRQTREQSAELQFNLAHSLFSRGQLERAKESFLVAEGLALSLEDHRRLGQIHGGMTYLLGSEGDFEGARRSGLRALTIGASRGDLALQVWASAGLGRVYVGQGNYRAAIERMRWVTGALKDVPIDERFGRGTLMPSVACRTWLALCLGHTGEFSEAGIWGGEGVRIAETVAGPQERMWAYYCLASVHLERGDSHLAMPLLEQAVPLCAEGRFPIYAPRVLASLGAARTMSGRPDAALPLLAQATAEEESTNLVYGRSATLIHTGEAHLSAGRLDEAHGYAQQALELTVRVGARADESRARHLLGEIACQGKPSEDDQALAHFTAALALATELGMAPLQARCHLGLGEVHQRLRRADEARRELAHAAAMLRAMQMSYWLVRSGALLSSAG
jgi:DNA-binding SARP family transcriptional activator